MATGKIAGPELDIHRLYKAHKSKMDFCVARQKSTDCSSPTGGATAVWSQHVLRNVPTKRTALQQGINRLNSSAFGRLRPSPLGGPRAGRPLGTSRSASAMSPKKRFHHLQDFLHGEDFFQDDDELAMTCMKLHEVVVVGTASKMSAREAKPEEKPDENGDSTPPSAFPVQLPAIDGQKSLIEPVQEAKEPKRKGTGKHLCNKLARKEGRKASTRAWEQQSATTQGETECSNSSDAGSNAKVECQLQNVNKTTDSQPKRVTEKSVARGTNSVNNQSTEDAATSVLTTSKIRPTRRKRLMTAPVLKLSPLTYFEVDDNNLCISDTLTSTPKTQQKTFHNRTRRVSEPIISTLPSQPRAESPRKSIIRARSTDGSSDSSSDSDGGRPGSESKRCARTVRFMGMEVKIYAPDAPVIAISHKG